VPAIQDEVADEAEEHACARQGDCQGQLHRARLYGAAVELLEDGD